MDEESEKPEKNKYVMMLNNILNDLHILRGDVCPMKHTPNIPNWKMYWSDDWLSSAGEDFSLDSDDDRSHMSRSHNGSVGSEKGDNTLVDHRNKLINRAAMMKPLPATPSSIHTSARPSPQSTPFPAPVPTQSTSPDTRTITYLERLTKTHPVWFLPEISRAGAVHLLKDKQPGTFIVRRSSQKDTWALSVHQSYGHQATVDHYLIEATSNGYTLQGSTNSFSDIPNLIAHYCQHVDELPERLLLPFAIRSATTTQQLASIALLGQDFWTLPNDGRQVSQLSHKLSSGPTIHKSISEPENMESFNSRPLVPLLPLSASQTLQPGHGTPENVSTFLLTRNASQSRVPCGELSKSNVLGVPAQSSESVPKASFYQSTSMDLLFPPETYYRSNLCDRMSDYSDVWRNDPSNSSFDHRSSNSSLDDKYYDANSDVLSDSPSWTYQATEAITESRRTGDTRLELDNSVSTDQRMYSEREIGGLSPERTPTAKTSNMFSHDYDTQNSVPSSDNTATPVNQCTQKTSPRGKPPPTPVKPTKLHRLRSNSSPSIYVENADNMKTVNPNLDSNSNEVHRSQTFHLKPPRSDLWLRRWRSLPFKLKQIELVDSSSRGSPFEAVSPRLRTVAMKQHITALKGSNNTSINNKQTCKVSPVHRKPSKPIPHAQSNVPSVSRPNDLNINPNKQPLHPTPHSPSKKFPLYSSQFSMTSESSTVSDIITKLAPELLVHNVKPLTAENLHQRASQYDNLAHHSRPVSLQTVNSNTTEYCRPWESSFWDSILKPQHYNERNSQLSEPRSRMSSTSSFVDTRLSTESQASVLNAAMPVRTHSSMDGHTACNGNARRVSTGSVRTDEAMRRSTKSVLSISLDATEDVIPVGLHVDNDDGDDDMCRRQSLPASLSSLQNGVMLQAAVRTGKDCVCRVRDYILKLSQDQSTTFGSAVENFVKCTLESSEPLVHTVMRNMRQFMNGIKNYLVTSGEGDLDKVIDEERNKLNSNAILNIDAIIEGALHKCVLRPLKQHVYHLLVNHYQQTGDLRLMSVNVKYARTLSPHQIGVPPGAPIPSRESMDTIRHFISRMQRAYSPLKKLQYFLSAVSAIYGAQNKDTEKGQDLLLGVDDFLPMLMYVLVDCGLISAEIEAEYMLGLLHPSILTGDGGYYLTTLSSAVHALKNLRASINDKHFSQNTQKSSDEGRGWMRVVIPDELSDTIVCRTVPVRPNITTKDVCTMLAHKLKITNPQDYGLFSLHQGDETALKDTACPHSEHPEARVRDRVFTYKRRAAKIAWPRSFNAAT